MIREVRDTLYDLRTDVSDEQGFLATLELFVGRVRERAGFDGHDARPTSRTGCRSPRSGSCSASPRRRSSTSSATPTPTTSRSPGAPTASGALLEVADDGTGFPVGRAGRLDSYGLLGMRERAASIGATLDVESAPGHGTRVRCVLAARPDADAARR